MSYRGPYGPLRDKKVVALADLGGADYADDYGRPFVVDVGSAGDIVYVTDGRTEVTEAGLSAGDSIQVTGVGGAVRDAVTCRHCGKPTSKHDRCRSCAGREARGSLTASTDDFDYHDLLTDTLLSRRPQDRLMVEQAFRAGVRGMIVDGGGRIR